MRPTIAEIEADALSCAVTMPAVGLLITIAKAGLKWQEATLAWDNARHEMLTSLNSDEYRVAADRMVPIAVARDEATTKLLNALLAVRQ